MKNQIWANLPVQDTERTRKFYTDLGFRLNKERDNGDQLASFKVGEDDLVIHFFQEVMFKRASGGEAADLNQGNELLITISAKSREEVDEWASKVKGAGGTLFSEPAEIQGGWYGCGFADPDGHKWNVFYSGN